MAETETAGKRIGITVAGAVLAAGAIYLCRSLLLPLWKGLVAAAGVALTWLGASHPISGWLIALGAVGTVCFMGVLLISLLSSSKPTEWDYRSGRFEGVFWRWGYYARRIQGLRPFCPRCDTQLILNQHPRIHYMHSGDFVGTKAYCDHCEAVVAQWPERFGDDIRDKIQSQIERKHRNGEWRAEVSEQRGTQKQLTK